VTNETGNTNRVLGIRKFQCQFRLVHCGTITPTLFLLIFNRFCMRLTNVVTSTPIYRN